MKIPLLISGYFYRFFLSPANGEVKVQLGPGKRNYFKGWKNVDANFLTAKIDVWADLKNKLPFRNGTVDAFYSHHVVEHFPDQVLLNHFKDMYRCLKPNGVIRVGGPHGDIAIKKFIENDKKWFTDFPDKRKSIGGKLVNLIYCRGEHLTLLTESYLKELLTDAGFTRIKFCFPRKQTNFPNLFDSAVLDTEWKQSDPKAPNTIIVEAVKISSC